MKKRTTAENLELIAAAWCKPDSPIYVLARRTNKHGSVAPGAVGDAIRLDTKLVLRKWVRTVLNLVHGPAADIDTTDVPTLAMWLTHHLGTISRLESASIFHGEIARVSTALEDLTTPPTETFMLGICRRTVHINAHGGTGPCGGHVKADPDRLSDVRCPRCHHTDTVEWWREHLVGDLPLLTVEQLADWLTGQGRRIRPGTIHSHVNRGILPAPTQKDDKGRNLYDREVVLAALLARN